MVMVWPVGLMLWWPSTVLAPASLSAAAVMATAVHAETAPTSVPTAATAATA